MILEILLIKNNTKNIEQLEDWVNYLVKMENIFLKKLRQRNSGILFY